MWEVCKKNYYDFGIDAFWLDNSEPDYGVYDFENYRYCDGPALSISNLYPQMFSRAFYDEMSKTGKDVVNLLRCAWAGSQKYGNVVWSGDVPSTFEAFADQLQCGLNILILQFPASGILWELIEHSPQQRGAVLVGLPEQGADIAAHSDTEVVVFAHDGVVLLCSRAGKE